MRVRERGAVLLIAALMAGCGEPPVRDDDRVGRRPNIVLIMADDLGYGDISAYGGWIETPHLDAMAAEGLRFTDFHSSGNVCSPTRAGLLTGRYQHRAGIDEVIFANPERPQYYQGLQDVEQTFAETFSNAGYRTALFGKWHLGYHAAYNPTRHGFDEFRGFVSGNLDYHSHLDMMRREDWWNGSELEDDAGYLTDLITEYAVAFIEAQDDAPFLLYLAHHAPTIRFRVRTIRPSGCSTVATSTRSARVQTRTSRIAKWSKRWTTGLDG